MRDRTSAGASRSAPLSSAPEVKHDLRSVSKSIVGLLYGIALADGQVPAPGQPLVDHFPYPDLATDPARARMTVAHALSMTLGTAWDESLPYTDPRNSEIAMEMAGDRYRFVLDRPLGAEPGTSWAYNGGTTALLARLIAAGTGMQLDDYARAKLFAPLGITDTEWVRGSKRRAGGGIGPAHAAARSCEDRAAGARSRPLWRAPDRAGRVARRLV
jgi:CubicO group peptidase (beta-lactamase class C family)